MTGDEDLEPTSPPGRWQPTIDALAAGLAAYLGEQVIVVDPGEMEDGFSCLIRGAEPRSPFFQVAWNGILGMEHRHGQPSISVTLFLYSRGRRLRLDNQSGSFLEIVYDGALDGAGTWRALGWLPDDLGEFEAHDRCGE